MTKKLTELFNLPDDTVESDDEIVNELTVEEVALVPTEETLATIEKIESALPQVRDLEASDAEMDEIAKKAIETFDDLKDLAFNVDSRYASELFNAASTMLGHAITAKTAKMNKKLKMISLQLQKAKLDQTAAKAAEKSGDTLQTGEGVLLDRNEILNRLLDGKSTNSKID